MFLNALFVALHTNKKGLIMGSGQQYWADMDAEEYNRRISSRPKPKKKQPFIDEKPNVTSLGKVVPTKKGIKIIKQKESS